MITIETITIDGRQFRRIFSDTNLIRKTGTKEIYSEAVDVLGAAWQYEETADAKPTEDIPVEEQLAATRKELAAAKAELATTKLQLSKRGIT